MHVNISAFLEIALKCEISGSFANIKRNGWELMRPLFYGSRNGKESST